MSGTLTLLNTRALPAPCVQTPTNTLTSHSNPLPVSDSGPAISVTPGTPPRAGTDLSPTSAYPFTMAMSHLSGSATNLNTLLGSQAPLPDDQDVETDVPTICVDYLSHDWAEDDVWASWKAMTKRKSSHGVDVRLENASWRTWAKRRSNLPTVSPQQLNWLKDSDVTWLYGPLHTAKDPDRSLTSAGRGNTLDPSPVYSDSSPRPAKPILKHRSFTDILSLPTLFNQDSAGSHTSSVSDDASDLGSPPASHLTTSPNLSHRPLYKTYSDSRLHRSERSSSVLNSNHPSSFSSPHTPEAVASATHCSSPISPDNSKFSSTHKRHISFNHQVEQWIAVDSEDTSPLPFYANLSADDGSLYDPVREDSTDSDYNEEQEGQPFEEVLTFCSSRTRGAPRRKQRRSPEEQHMIVARLEPTTLKSSDSSTHTGASAYHNQSDSQGHSSLLVTAQSESSTRRSQYPELSHQSDPNWDFQVQEVDEESEQEAIDYDYAYAPTNTDPIGDFGDLTEVNNTALHLTFGSPEKLRESPSLPPERSSSSSRLSEAIEEARKAGKQVTSSEGTTATIVTSTNVQEDEEEGVSSRGRSASRRQTPAFQDRIIPGDKRPHFR